MHRYRFVLPAHLNTHGFGMLRTEVLNFASTSDQRSHKETFSEALRALPMPNTAEAKESRRKRAESPASGLGDAEDSICLLLCLKLNVHMQNVAVSSCEGAKSGVSVQLQSASNLRLQTFQSSSTSSTRIKQQSQT